MIIIIIIVEEVEKIDEGGKCLGGTVHIRVTGGAGYVEPWEEPEPGLTFPFSESGHGKRG